MASLISTPRSRLSSSLSCRTPSAPLHSGSPSLGPSLTHSLDDHGGRRSAPRRRRGSLSCGRRGMGGGAVTLSCGRRNRSRTTRGYSSATWASSLLTVHRRRRVAPLLTFRAGAARRDVAPSPSPVGGRRCGGVVVLRYCDPAAVILAVMQHGSTVQAKLNNFPKMEEKQLRLISGPTWSCDATIKSVEIHETLNKRQLSASVIEQKQVDNIIRCKGLDKGLIHY